MTVSTAESLNRLTSTIIDAATRVHRTIGLGLLENAYLACLRYELVSGGWQIEVQKAISLRYDAVVIDCAYRADLVVADAVIVEVKALEALAPIHSRQLYTYLRLADCRVGLLLNFGAKTMREGIKRIVNKFLASAQRPRAIPLPSRAT
jgi:GxxExxY protein